MILVIGFILMLTIVASAALKIGYRSGVRQRYKEARRQYDIAYAELVTNNESTQSDSLRISESMEYDILLLSGKDAEHTQARKDRHVNAINEVSAQIRLLPTNFKEARKHLPFAYEDALTELRQHEKSLNAAYLQLVDCSFNARSLVKNKSDD